MLMILSPTEPASLSPGTNLWSLFLLSAFHPAFCVATDGNQNFSSFAVPAKANHEGIFLSGLNVCLLPAPARLTRLTVGAVPLCSRISQGTARFLTATSGKSCWKDHRGSLRPFRTRLKLLLYQMKKRQHRKEGGERCTFREPQSAFSG